MNKLLPSVLLTIIMATSVFGQAALPAPGITPDSPFYGLDVAFDRISLALTFGNAAKAEKGLQIAQERLAEIQAMADKGNAQGVQKAEQEHKSFLADVNSSLQKISSTNATRQLQEEASIQKQLDQHLNLTKDVESHVLSTIDSTNMTTDQKDFVKSIISAAMSDTESVSAVASARAENSLVRAANQTGSSVETIRKRVGISAGNSVCITLYKPVCGTDGKTYSNECFAKLAGAQVASSGECGSSGQKAAAANGKTEEISILSTGYSRSSITISAGTTVTWTNDDDQTHTIDSTGGDFTLSSGNINPGDSFSYTFGAPGTYSYSDAFTNMQGGVVIVK